MKLSIIDYGAGNIKSIQFAFERLGIHAQLTSNVDDIKSSTHVIFPGVGEASSAMKKLRESGLDQVIPQLKQPVLGICLGMQLMCNYSEEGSTKALGLFDVDIIKFKNSNLKVPQVGWNAVENLKGHLFDGIPEGAHFYLVHSYYAPKHPEAIATAKYGEDYAVAFQHYNFYGVQFHPEKSGAIGEQLLKNFINLPANS